MITNEAVNRAIDYILQHVDEELTLEDVAEYCHFSKFYFSRLFREQTGESVYAFIRRTRLEQSAFRLKTEKDRPVTQIGADYGYSPSNYSSAFRLHYHKSPVDFRRSSGRDSMEHPFFHREKYRMETFGECSAKITIEEIPDCYVIYERRFGSYESLSRSWNEFIEKYREYITADTRFLERTWDDPAVTDPDGCLYDIGMSVSESCPLANRMLIPGGRCIVYHFKGQAKHIYAAYQTIFLVWLPRTSYELDNHRGMFDIYHVVERDPMAPAGQPEKGDARHPAAGLYMELDICLPLKE